MAFPGTEVLEVAPTAGPLGVGQSGAYVFCVGGYQTSILNTSTGGALIYESPGNLNISTSIGCQSGVAWWMYATGSYGKYAFGSISTSGVTQSVTFGATVNTYPSPMTLVCDTYVHGIISVGGWPTYRWQRLDTSTMTGSEVSFGISSPPIWTAGVVGSTIYDTANSATVTAWNPKRDTAGSSWPLPLAAQSPGTTVGTTIWWQAPNGMVSFDTATNTAYGVVATPGTGYPASNRKPAILGDVAYWIHSDNTKMVAFNLSTGQWKLDDLATSRSGRTGVGVGAGKLWIPSTVTPP